jgi:hypothetical protein
VDGTAHEEARTESGGCEMAAVNARIYISLETSNAMVSLLTDGSVTCQNHPKKNWCEHIQFLVENDLDSSSIFEPYLYHILQIPMMPSLGLWTKIRLDPVNAITAYSVTNLGFSGNRDDFLGMIHPGEGRRVIRLMMLDWFKGHVDYENLICPSSKHSYIAEMVFKSDARQGLTRWLPQVWSIWEAGCCLICSGILNEDFGDLVPEDGRPASPFRR